MEPQTTSLPLGPWDETRAKAPVLGAMEPISTPLARWCSEQVFPGLSVQVVPSCFSAARRRIQCPNFTKWSSLHGLWGVGAFVFSFCRRSPWFLVCSESAKWTTDTGIVTTATSSMASWYVRKRMTSCWGAEGLTESGNLVAVPRAAASRQAKMPDAGSTTAGSVPRFSPGSGAKNALQSGHLGILGVCLRTCCSDADSGVRRGF